jgi:SAM-dependent methyltransferase
MDKSLLVRIIGFPAALIHGNPAVLDRWLWLKKRLPKTRNGETLIDIGCGTGAFSIGASLRGYQALGLSWDERNQRIARERAKLSKADTANFEVLDVRRLNDREDLREKFDVAICCENIEHILDDRKLLQDISMCLKPGGRLLLTTPYLLYRPVTPGDMGPFQKTEEGWHVRRGYTQIMLEELCRHAGLLPERFSYCTGFLSQKLCWLMATLAILHPMLGWAAVLPFRFLPPVLDSSIFRLSGFTYYSICMEAYKPRFGDLPVAGRLSGVSQAFSTETSQSRS